MKEETVPRHRRIQIGHLCNVFGKNTGSNCMLDGEIYTEVFSVEKLQLFKLFSAQQELEIKNVKLISNAMNKFT